MLDTNNTITWTTPYSGNNFSTFGEDYQKGLYVADLSNGKIFKISTGTLGTNENTLGAVKVYPNPASKEIFIDGVKDKKATLEIISAEGRKVMETDQIINGKAINISGIPAGVYYINLKSGELKSYSQKLIIK